MNWQGLTKKSYIQDMWYVTLRWTANRNGKTVPWYYGKIWAMNIWGNQNLNIMFYYARKKKNKQSLVTSHKAIILHITEHRFCHINGSLMGCPHLKDRCVLICVILRNTAGSGNYLSGQQILQNEKWFTSITDFKINLITSVMKSWKRIL